MKRASCPIAATILLALLLALLPAGRAAALPESCVAPPAGLVSWWRAEENAGDHAGANDGTILNHVGYVNGLVGRAFSFDGVDDLVQVPYSADLDLTGSLTYLAWVKAEDLTGIRVIAGKYHGTQIYSDGATVVFGIYSGSGEWQLAATGDVLTAGAWHLVAGTFDASTGEIGVFVDGVQEASLASGLSATASNDQPVEIGGLHDTTTWWQGAIDEAAILGRALSQPEVQAVYDAGSLGICARTLVLQPGPEGKDAGAMAHAPDASVADSSHVTIRESNCNAADDYGFFQFDLSSVPAGTVVRATLRVRGVLYFNGSGWPWEGDPTYGARAVTSAWEEATLTWNNQPTVGAEILDTDGITGIAGLPAGQTVEQWISFDVTGLVTGWLAGTVPNHGVRLEQTNSFCVNGDEASFCTSDHPDPAQRPVLEVVFAKPIIESIYVAPPPPPLVDGWAGEGEWTGPPQIVFDDPEVTNPARPVVPTYVYFRNSRTDLFVLVDAVGDETEDVGGPYVGDECLLLFGSGATTLVAEVFGDQSTNLCSGDGTPVTGIEVVAGFGATPNGATPHRVYEWKIPFASIGASPGQDVDFVSPLQAKFTACGSTGPGSMPYDASTGRDNVWPPGVSFMTDKTDRTSWGILRVPATTLFFDDFSDGTEEGDPDWEEVAGAWRTSLAFSYVASATRANRALVTGVPALESFAVGALEAKVKLPRRAVKAPNGGLVFHAVDNQNYRYARLKKTATGGKLILGQVVGGVPGVVRAKKLALRSGRFYTLRLHLFEDGLVEAFVDGTEMTEWAFTPASGRVGLTAVKSKSVFDDVLAETLPGQ